MSDTSSLPVVRTVADLRAQVAGWRRDGLRVGFVPTMGALHAGHLSLVAEAARHADRIVASIFVNPKQFAAGEDLERYPRMEDTDSDKLKDAGTHLLFAPNGAEMYPPGFTTDVRVVGLSDVLCGAHRAGHFDGVAVVVTKLLLQCLPDVAVFGEKDWQQLQIIKRLVLDLNIPVTVLGSETIREADGLAMSSRNAYLSPEERQIAAAIPKVMAETIEKLRNAPNQIAPALTAGVSALLAAGFQSVDYLELRTPSDLAEMTSLDQPGRLFVAARLGGARLIDNWPVDPKTLAANP